MNESELLHVEIVPEPKVSAHEFRHDVRSNAFYAQVLSEPVESSLTIEDITLDLLSDGRLRGIESISPPETWRPDRSVEMPTGSRGQLRFDRVEGHIVYDLSIRYLVNLKANVLCIVLLPNDVAEVIEVSGHVRAGLDSARRLTMIWVSLVRAAEASSSGTGHGP